METKTQTTELYYNSAEDPMAHFVINDEDGSRLAVDPEAVTAQLRREAIRYIGRNALPTAGRLGVRMGSAVLRGLSRSIESVREQD